MSLFSPTALAGKVAMVTGAAGGIGRHGITISMSGKGNCFDCEKL